MRKGYIWIPIDKLRKAKWNYKKESKEKSEKLNRSLKEFGQIQNVIVREKAKFFEIINGNHRLDQLLELGEKRVMCYNLGKNISDTMAYKIGIVTNEEHFEADTNKLNELLKHIINEESIENSAKILPYDEEWLKLITDDKMLADNPIFEAPPPINDEIIEQSQKAFPEDYKNKAHNFFKVGNYINEMIEVDMEMLYDALDYFKNKHNSDTFYEALLKEFYAQKQEDDLKN